MCSWKPRQDSQSVNIHRLSVCFGRAPAPQCHSKLQRGRHSPAVHPFPPGLGRAGEGGLQSMLSSILGHTVFGTHGFSRLLGSPLGGVSTERPEGCLRRLPAWASLWLRCPSSWALEWDSPYLRVNFGLVAWSLFSPLLLSRSWAEFQKGAGWRPVMPSLIVEFVMRPGGDLHHPSPPDAPLPIL